MSITPKAIEAEHNAAIDSLTRAQHRALARVQRAVQMSHFNHHKIVENLQQIFEEEARRRNEAASQTTDEATERPDRTA